MPTALRFGLNLVMFKQLVGVWAAMSAAVLDPQRAVLVGQMKPADKSKLIRGHDEENCSDDEDDEQDEVHGDSDDEDGDGEPAPVTKRWIRKCMATEDPVTAIAQYIPFRTALGNAVDFFTPLMQVQRLGDMDKATACYVAPAVERMEKEFQAAIDKGDVPCAAEARDAVMEDVVYLKHPFFIVAALYNPRIVCGANNDPLPALTEEQTTAFDAIMPKVLHSRVKLHGLEQTPLDAKTEMTAFRQKSGLFAGHEKGELRCFAYALPFFLPPLLCVHKDQALCQCRRTCDGSGTVAVGLRKKPA
jgi:hypothetical protein